MNKSFYRLYSLFPVIIFGLLISVALRNPFLLPVSNFFKEYGATHPADAAKDMFVLIGVVIAFIIDGWWHSVNNGYKENDK